MIVIETAGLTPEVMTAMPAEHQYWSYNGLDTCITHEVRQVLEKQLPPEAQAVYQFCLGSQAPALEMMLRGIRIDQTYRQAELLRNLNEIEQLQSNLDAFAEAVWERGLNPRSPTQLQKFFYGTLKLPPQWKNDKGNRKISTDREALEGLRAYLLAQPFVSHILAIRDRTKTAGVLSTGIDPDGRIRCSYNIGGTETGRWSSSANAFGTGCVLPSTEVLTRNGWRRIDSIAPGTEIAQWDNGQIDFVPCGIHSEHFSGNMLRAKTEQFQATLTPCHRVLHNPVRKTGLVEAPAAAVSQKSVNYIPLAGQSDGTLSYPAYLAMLMADFSKEGRGWRGAFKKARKIERFHKLAQEFGFTYDEQPTLRDGYRRFKVWEGENWPKTWGEWVLSLTKESAQALLEEARHWDSHDRGSGFIFYSADKDQAEWFATLAHIAGKSATIRRMEQSAASWSTTTIWSVNVKSRDFAQVMRKHWSSVPYEGKVYCPQVPSTFWLMRENGFISVTGNTNLQNISPSLRRMFIADPGFMFCNVDLEQAESRVVGLLAWLLTGKSSYLDACESGDLHTLVCKMIWPGLAWPGDPKGDKDLAEEPNFLRHFSRRDIAKRVGHASNYYGQPHSIAKIVGIPREFVEQFQTAYFRAFPEIRDWHRDTARTLQTTGKLTTPLGRTRHFFGRLRDDATLREAIAYVPQSTIGDLMNIAVNRLWRWGKVQLLAQVHDSELFQFRETDQDALVSEALSVMRVPLSFPGRLFEIPLEAKVGWNWGYFNDDPKRGPINVDGLKGLPNKRKRAYPAA